MIARPVTGLVHSSRDIAAFDSPLNHLVEPPKAFRRHP
jgi:hypothetical protein